MGRVATYQIPPNPQDYVAVNVRGHTRFSAFDLSNPEIPTPTLLLQMAYEPSNFVDAQCFFITPQSTFNSWITCDYVFPDESVLIYFKLANEAKAPVLLSVHTEIELKGDGW